MMLDNWICVFIFLSCGQINKRHYTDMNTLIISYMMWVMYICRVFLYNFHILSPAYLICYIV